VVARPTSIVGLTVVVVSCCCFFVFLEPTTAFFVVAANVFYFTLFSAFYSSRDGGLATWEHMFTLQWYQSGGGDVLHYYVLLDCVMNPFLLAVRTGRQRMIRAKKLRKAVCQEQLNQVHTGIELDYMCEYLLALVCPAISIVLCQGLPMLPNPKSTFHSVQMLYRPPTMDTLWTCPFDVVPSI